MIQHIYLGTGKPMLISGVVASANAWVNLKKVRTLSHKYSWEFR